MKLPFILMARSGVQSLLGLGLAFSAAIASAQLPAFNGAEGYGGSFTGTAPAAGWFSNATVYHVTNLNDSGPGSLRGAFVQNSANKIIVFDVGGTIQLNDNLDIKNLSNYYIAGQTAPSPVTIYGDTTQLTHSSNKTNSNVILRYLTFRKGTGDGQDAITFAGGGLGTNLILDHVSASWSEDEILSVANNNTNVTVQYSVISDALVSNHAYGSLIRPRIDSNVSFHHNLYAHNASRQARFGTYNASTLVADFRNNVIYNWRDRASYAGGSSEDQQEFADVNYVGNYLIAGPGTISNTNRAFHVDKNIDVRVYQSGNFIDSDRALNPGGVPNGADTGWGMFVVSTPVTDQSLTQMATPFAMAPVTTQFALDAYHQVLNHVGNYWWSRDAIDARVVNNVRTNTGPMIGAADPIPSELSSVLTAPMTTRPAGWDSDNDGMPDVWEVAHGLNAHSNLDFKLDFDNDGFINLQEYLDEVGAFPAPAPIVFHGATNNRYAEITNWQTDDGGITAGSPWQPTRFDEAQIHSGAVVVDAVGQHAGVLKIAAGAGDNATLEITSGWLDVDEAVVIGAAASATAALNLSGGVLSTPVLSRGPGGSFNFIGGMLHADVVTFDLENQGGTLAPGHSIGQARVMGELSLNSGTLEIELASAAASDKLLIDGAAQLGGTLDVRLLDGFAPSSGDLFEILHADAGIFGEFALTSLPALSTGLDWNVVYSNFAVLLQVVPALAGDYNNDGAVDAADYVVLRKQGGTPAEYDTWRANFGRTTAVGAASRGPTTAVPEPASFTILVALLAIAATRRDAPWPAPSCLAA